MRTNHHEPRDPDALRDMGYETTDVNIKGVRVTSIAFTSLMVLTIIFVGLWYGLRGPGSKGVPGLVNRQLPQRNNPNNPVLQDSVTTKTDIMTIRQTEAKVLGGTRYVDQNKGIVSIPIERAMDAVASGRYISTGTVLPARTPGQDAASGGANPSAPRNPQTP